MSFNEENSEDFIVVNNKKRKNRRKYQLNENYLKLIKGLTISSDFALNFDNINDKINLFTIDLENSNYSKNVFLSFDKCFSLQIESNNVKFDSIICYGLGNFTTNKASLYQLSLLLIIGKQFQCKQISIYDPVFTDEEIKILSNKLMIKVIEENEQSIHTIDDNSYLFFMPHCDKSMFNNLLWANWDANRFSRIYIFGNSFNNMLETIISDRMAFKSFTYLYLICNVFKSALIECLVKNDFIHKEIFSDLSIHGFNKQNIDENLFKQYYNNQKPLYNEIGDLL